MADNFLPISKDSDSRIVAIKEQRRYLRQEFLQWFNAIKRAAAVKV